MSDNEIEGGLVDQDGDKYIFELISRVESRQFIYNCRDPKHSRRDAIAVAWNEIAEEFLVKGKKKDGSWCRKKWKTLRDYYYRVKKTMKGKSGDGAKDKKPWIYYNAMDRVLASCVEENENTQSNFPGDDSDFNEAETPGSEGPAECSDKNTATVNNEGTPSETTHTTSALGTSRKRKYNTEEQLSEKILQVLEEPEEVKDEYYHYGMSICKKLRTIPPHIADYAMLRISQVLFEVMYPPPTPIYAEPGPNQNQYESTPKS